MIISRRRITKQIANEILAGKNQQATLKQLAAYLIDKKLTSQADRFVADIEQHLAEAGHVTATVTTARPIDADLKSQLVNFIKANSQSVSLKEQIDESILGGVIITTPSAQFDASLKTKIRRLITG